jgi:periplasmic protein TonB
LDTSIHNNQFDGNGIVWAVTASILLHVLIVIVVPNFDFSKKEEERQVLKIELQQPTPPAPVQPVAEPLPPIEIPEPPKPKPIEKKPDPIIKPKPIKKEAPAPIEEPEPTPAPMVEEVIAVQPSLESVPEIVIPQPPPPLEPPPPAQPSQADIDNALDRYGSLLGRSIAKHKSYPKIAERRGWQGTTLLDLKIDSNGHVLSVAIRESSGYETLDTQALKMVEKASPFPAPPDVLQGRSFNITVPVSFKLANG